MNQFTASNRMVVDPNHRLGLSVGNTMKTIIAPDDAEALREFFQAERDERLKRWRSPTYDHFVVYDYRVDGQGHFYTLEEITGERRMWDRYPDITPAGTVGGTWQYHAQVAREFLEAHWPEDKPWLAAKKGEVWELECASKPFPATIVQGQWRTVGGNGPILLDNITAGRRIWPEGDED